MEPTGEKDPYRAVWQMSQVGGTDGRPDRRIRWVAGILTGLAVLLPFGLVTIVFGFFTSGAIAVLIIGLSIAATVGGYVATQAD